MRKLQLKQEQQECIVSQQELDRARDRLKQYGGEIDAKIASIERALQKTEAAQSAAEAEETSQAPVGPQAPAASLPTIDEFDEDAMRAATKVQAHARGRKGRQLQQDKAMVDVLDGNVAEHRGHDTRRLIDMLGACKDSLAGTAPAYDPERLLREALRLARVMLGMDAPLVRELALELRALKRALGEDKLAATLTREFGLG